MSLWKRSSFLLTLAIFIVCIDHDAGTSDNPGIAITVQLTRTEYELGESIAAAVTIVNRTGDEQTVTVPGNAEGIALVRAVHQAEHWQGEFVPESRLERAAAHADISDLFVYTLGPYETLEQTYVWDQRVADPWSGFGSGDDIPAPSGSYKLLAVVLAGEMERRDGESLDAMIARYGARPLADISSEAKFAVAGERDLISVQEAITLALEDARAGQWFAERTYAHLVKEENGIWYLKDTDGQWARTDRRTVESLREIEPRFAGGERTEERLVVRFRSELGGSPREMAAAIDTRTRQVVSVDWSD
ncbi:hypothetical protein [Paenibacillus sp.]|uniref:hypothetical protein n=1 Tax=Paenibacillus sp. TaxID=58172 RepID=UPI002D37487E|nr:hypothetical protein [Paenibacillus sp.]HZG84653.1 hypothetical protein [Paenibacillus sp.]